MIRVVHLTIACDKREKSYLIRFAPSENLKTEILDVSRQNIDFGNKIKLSIHRGTAILNIYDDLSYQMLIERLKESRPEEWDSIFKYIYAIV